ncbi:MAG: sulfotransferase domain-containing protein [Paracoccaceae bacterium]
MPNSLPTIEHVYQNAFLNSTRWQQIPGRDDDIIIATPYKCGTTWMQNIVLHLIFQDLKVRNIGTFSRWVDMRVQPIAEMVAELEAQEHRRVMKSHLPLDGLEFRPNAKYVVVGRDPRDVFMSLWNHYSSYTPEILDAVNNTEGRVGPPLEPCPDNIRTLWDMWINRGWFEWETEGYPHWSNFRHIQTWWDYRHLPNILFIHFNDLLADLNAEIARISKYLEIDCTSEMRAAITEKTTFKGMKKDAEGLQENASFAFKGGANTFINKGTNGRWRDVLTEGDLAMYDATVERELSPECHQWIENGRGGVITPPTLR